MLCVFILREAPSRKTRSSPSSVTCSHHSNCPSLPRAVVKDSCLQFLPSPHGDGLFPPLLLGSVHSWDTHPSSNPPVFIRKPVKKSYIIPAPHELLATGFSRQSPERATADLLAHLNSGPTLQGTQKELVRLLYLGVIYLIEIYN